MENVLRVVTRIFTFTFVNDGSNSYLLKRIIESIVNNPYLIVGVTLMIIGFSVSLISRLIRS